MYPDACPLHLLMLAFVGEIPAGQHRYCIIVGKIFDAECLGADDAIGIFAAGAGFSCARAQRQEICAQFDAAAANQGGACFNPVRARGFVLENSLGDPVRTAVLIR